MSTAISRRRIAAAIAIAVSYALLAHLTNILPKMKETGIVLALGPLALVGFSWVWNSKHRSIGIAFLIGLCALVPLAWRMLEMHYSTIYWMEHAGTQLALGLLFGRTLVSGQEPMCTRFARAIHGTLNADTLHYTRQVTIAWVVFFIAMSLSSTLIFMSLPLSVWSTFANFVTGPLIGCMFVGEHVIRRRLYPNMEHARVIDVIGAVWSGSAR